jgi:hypothetical protein
VWSCASLGLERRLLGAFVVWLDAHYCPGVCLRGPGPAGSKVGVLVKRPKTGETKDLVVTRQQIKIKALEASLARKVSGGMGNCSCMLVPSGLHQIRCLAL